MSFVFVDFTFIGLCRTSASTASMTKHDANLEKKVYMGKTFPPFLLSPKPMRLEKLGQIWFSSRGCSPTASGRHSLALLAATPSSQLSSEVRRSPPRRRSEWQLESGERWQENECVLFRK
jgi:hypothetical protein